MQAQPMIRALVLLAALAMPGSGYAAGLDPATEIEPFVREQVAAGGVDADRVRRVLAHARVLPEVVERMTRPAETLPWHRYRKIFLTARRVEAGRAFVAEHRELLAAAHRRFGVDPAIVAAIIGVESFYGRHRGRLRVLYALATLGFRFERRSAFFRTELVHFLRLADEEGIDPTAALGSYAGAMGLAQFIPSSYRHYAVDFDGDGRRDLFSSVGDAIGSVANYLAEHGWQRDRAVAFEVSVTGERYRELLGAGIEPSVTAAELVGFGVERVPAELAADRRVALIELAAGEGPEYWIGLRNFYVITRYNHSPLYAMAVHQLATAIGAGG